MLKKFFAMLSMVAMCTLFVSCESDEETNYYDYHSTSSSQEVNGVASDFTEINNALAPRLNRVYQLTPAEAQAEWNSFISEIDESKLVFVGGDFYTVKLRKLVETDGRFEVDVVVNEKTWGNQ